MSTTRSDSSATQRALLTKFTHYNISQGCPAVGKIQTLTFWRISIKTLTFCCCTLLDRSPSSEGVMHSYFGFPEHLDDIFWKNKIYNFFMKHFSEIEIWVRSTTVQSEKLKIFGNFRDFFEFHLQNRVENSKIENSFGRDRKTSLKSTRAKYGTNRRPHARSNPLRVFFANIAKISSIYF